MTAIYLGCYAWIRTSFAMYPIQEEHINMLRLGEIVVGSKAGRSSKLHSHSSLGLVFKVLSLPK